MRRAAAFTHGRPETVGDGLRRLARVAAEHGVELVLPQVERAKHAGDASVLALPEGDWQSCDLVIVLGGDGTVLRALNHLLGRGTPALAINYGRVGFLTTAAAEALEETVTRAFRGDYRIEELPTLEVTRNGERLGLAVNDVVVTGAAHGRMVFFSWAVNDVAMGDVGCDATIVSTPAGSTAYNLSAGGPVLAWGLDAACVAFASPHSLVARPLVLSRGHRITIEPVAWHDVSARIVLDGHAEFGGLAPGQRAEIALGEERARLALLPEVSFLQRFRDWFAR